MRVEFRYSTAHCVDVFRTCLIACENGNLPHLAFKRNALDVDQIAKTAVEDVTEKSAPVGYFFVDSRGGVVIEVVVVGKSEHGVHDRPNEEADETKPGQASRAETRAHRNRDAPRQEATEERVAPPEAPSHGDVENPSVETPERNDHDLQEEGKVRYKMKNFTSPAPEVSQVILEIVSHQRA